MLPRTANDGGSIHFSLQVNATTSIVVILPFTTTKLFFVPELSIKSLIGKETSIHNFRSTISFVIVQVDLARKNDASMYKQLTIVDGLLSTNRATMQNMSFFNWLPFVVMTCIA